MRNNPEAIIQAAIVKAIRSAGYFCASFPNELAKSNPVATGQAITCGLYPGISDLIVILPSGVAVFLEVKTKTGVLSDRQKRFRQKCIDNGWHYSVVRSVEESIDFLKNIVDKP